jgi:hypothetical protein
MLDNIRNFDGWMIVDSYENITIGKGVITLHVNSLKTMMEYMPIVEELDRRVNEINKFNKIVLMNSSSGRFNKVEEYDTRFSEFLDMIDALYREFKERNLEITSYCINAFSDNYFEEIILIKK